MKLVRSATQRAAKYAAKTDADVVRARVAAQTDSMNAAQAAQVTTAVQIETDVKAIVEPSGTPTIQIPFYIAFGRQLYKLKGKFPTTGAGSTGSVEAQTIATKWQGRGLEPALLIDIAQKYGFTVVLPS